MKPVTVGLFLLLWALGGCRATQPLTTQQPELVHISSLPSLAAFADKDRLILNVLFCLLPDGHVGEVRILGTSGDRKWDSAATDSMKQWLFGKIPSDTPPEGLWIRQTVVAQAEDRIVMNLGELIVPGEREADSLYTLLTRGTAFEALLREAGAGTGISGAVLGATDIAQYPGRVRDELRSLNVGGVTRPIRLGGNFVIYKRFRDEAGPVFPQ